MHDAGLKVAFDSSTYAPLDEALRTASKRIDKLKPGKGIVDVFAVGKDWIIIVENKKKLKDHVGWDSSISPFRALYLQYDEKSVVKNAENGVFHYMEKIFTDWPDDAIRPKHLLGLAISMEDLKHCL